MKVAFLIPLSILFLESNVFGLSEKKSICIQIHSSVIVISDYIPIKIRKYLNPDKRVIISIVALQ